jgi:carboxymethylenebutenolidase
MKRLFPSLTIATAILLTSFTASCSAQAWARAALDKSPRHGEFVTITEASGRKLQAWVVYPEVKDRAPVVVMIHEIFGLSDWAREMADEVAAEGYIVVEPDLLSGFGPPPGAAAAAAPDAAMDHMNMQAAPGAAGAAFVPASPGGTAAFPDQSAVTKAVSGLDPAQVTADLDAASDYGKKLPAASGKLFVAGFCWGGGKSFLFATQRKDLSAAFVFYGPPPPTDALKSITAPVYGFYAENDARITASVFNTSVDMKAAGKFYDPVVYDGAGHGFMRAGEDPNPDANVAKYYAANVAARKQGFQRLVRTLGSLR